MIAGRPPVELRPSATAAPGDRPVPPAADLVVEVEALAALLADVVVLTGDGAMFPGRLAAVVELALEHDSVRRALADDESAS